MDRTTGGMNEDLPEGLTLWVQYWRDRWTELQEG